MMGRNPHPLPRRRPSLQRRIEIVEWLVIAGIFIVLAIFVLALARLGYAQETPGTAPTSETVQVCFRTSAAPPVQLGCVPKVDWLPITGVKFTVDGLTLDVRETLPPAVRASIPGRRFANGDGLLLAAIESPPGRAEGINFMAALRVPRAQLLAAVDVIPRAVDADGDTAERGEPIHFDAAPPMNPKPKAPTLILIDELRAGLLEQLRGLDRAEAAIAAQQAAP